MSTSIERVVRESVTVKEAFFAANAALVRQAADRVVAAFRDGGKLLIYGNGGSAADAQHLAAELVNRFRAERPALPAIALTTDSSIVTSVGNDSAFEEVFRRQIQALGRRGDVGLAISTSGNSPNVLRGTEQARESGLFTIALTGRDGGRLGSLVDLHLNVATQSTARAQEVHILVVHVICELIDEAFAG